MGKGSLIMMVIENLLDTIDVVKQKLKKESDPFERAQLFDTLLMLYNSLVFHLKKEREKQIERDAS
jgi:hypothetical protein